MMQPNICELASLPPRPIENLNFQSAGEFACAKMLEKYLGWRGLEGITFQIPVGRAVYDFRYEDTFIEYHPISLRNELKGETMEALLSSMRGMPKDKKATLITALEKELFSQYWKRRGQVLSAHPSYGNMKLYCCNGPEGFITDIIYRFSSTRCPKMIDMKQEFSDLVSSYCSSNKKSK